MRVWWGLSRMRFGVPGRGGEVQDMADVNVEGRVCMEK